MTERKYNISDDQIDRLVEVAKQTEIHCALDWEITLGGNGVNAHEALSVISAVLQILQVPRPEVTEEEIAKVAKQYGRHYE